MGVAFFLVSSVGGAAIGLILGVITSIITKYTYKMPGHYTIILMTMICFILFIFCRLFFFAFVIYSALSVALY